MKLFTLFKTRDHEYHTGLVQRDMPKKGVLPSGDSSGSNHRTPSPPPPNEWLGAKREFSFSHHELTENTSSYVIMPNVCCYLSLSIEGFWNLKFVQIKFSVLTQTGCVRMEMLLGNVTIFTVGYNAFPAMTSYLYLITVNTQNGQVESILKGHMYLRIEQRDKWWRGGGGLF